MQLIEFVKYSKCHKDFFDITEWTENKTSAYILIAMWSVKEKKKQLGSNTMNQYRNKDTNNFSEF